MRLDSQLIAMMQIQCLVVSRTGWSSELGYELYLRDGSKGNQLWELIMAAGASHGLKPGHTSSIRRIEGGMLSYHADADIDTNPFELGFDRLVNLDMDAEFIGKAALRKIKQEGPMRKQVGLVLDCAPLTGPNTTFWAIQQDGATIGKVTSAVYSPRLKQNTPVTAYPFSLLNTVKENKEFFSRREVEGAEAAREQQGQI